MKSVAKPRYHHGALEEALVDEAVRQIRERGADQVSLRGLAQTIGVSPSAAYQHFPDKAALLQAVCGAGGAELARRMRTAVGAVTQEGDAGAVGRLLAVGRAYVEFALAEPHLFRHMFGPAAVSHMSTTSTDDEADDEPYEAYAILLERLAEVSQRGLLRVGVEEGPGIDVLAWSVVHGFSYLVVDGHLPAEAGDPLLALFGRLALTDEGFGTFATALAARPGLPVQSDPTEPPGRAGGR
jgi:AcrR family transcriptional regulator